MLIFQGVSDLGGGFKHFLFSPRFFFGRFPIWLIFFSWVVQPPTRDLLWVKAWNPETTSFFSSFFSGCFNTWRIIPVSKWSIAPIYKPQKRPFARGTTRSLGDLRSPWLLITE